MKDILRSRLTSNMDEKVAKFTSSLGVDQWIFKIDLLVDKAHVIMLCEQGIIQKDDCSAVLKALDTIDKMGISYVNLSGHEDVHIAIESKLIDLVGEVGGRMHSGRSRNDEIATCIRIAIRDELLDIMGEIVGLRKTLVNLAGKHTKTAMPGFTHLQHAQPTTFGHHLIAYADAFERDFNRLVDAYVRVNLCPLGAVALASTGFPINRERTAKLLGFDNLVENSMDAVSTRDFAIECISAFANTMVDLSRIAEDFILWGTSEFDFIELDDRYASTSSVMPQKKNPDVLELIRAKTGSVCGDLMSAITICKALPYSYNIDLQEVSPHLLNAVKITKDSVCILAGTIDTMQVKIDVMEAATAVGFITATELSDTMVRITKIPFRTAHRIVGALAMCGEKPVLEKIDDIATKIIGKRLSDMGLTKEAIDKALDVENNIRVRSIIGGPSPDECERMIKERINRIESDEILLKQKTNKINIALKQLNAIVRSGVQK
ncbi:MAG: argininosuccinate lyase [Methanocellales archaeon]|nr:argininosuccinate lyase [Methanocellales archaeon]